MTHLRAPHRFFYGLLLASSLTAPMHAHAYRATHETELLGMHLKNPSGTPARYATSSQPLMGRNVMPLYPERFDEKARITKAPAATPKPVAVIPATPISMPQPAVAAPLASSTPQTLAAQEIITTASPEDDNGSIQVAATTAPTQPVVSPLAIPVSQMQLPPPPSAKAIRAFEEKTIVPTALQTRALPQPVAAQPAAVKPAAIKPQPDIIDPVVAYAPDPLVNTQNHAPLSPQSKQVLGAFPARIDSPALQQGKLNVNRVSPDIAKIVTPQKADASYEAAGIKIEVRRAGLDSNHEIVRAYDTLMAGNISEAIQIYRDILSVEPNHEEALFGLAATLHRNGATDKARPLYARLLKLNPTHREALNNYLSLAGEEAPQSALLEMERLRLRNPSFSPIPAQMGMLYAKTGQFEQARSALMTAIQLAPENLAYQYNLAVILDQYGETADAASLYGSLLKANSNGAKLPVDTAQIQKRYQFLTQSITGGTRVSSAQ